MKKEKPTEEPCLRDRALLVCMCVSAKLKKQKEKPHKSLACEIVWRKPR
jgi:hypothetical protein